MKYAHLSHAIQIVTIILLAQTAHGQGRILRMGHLSNSYPGSDGVDISADGSAATGISTLGPGFLNYGAFHWGEGGMRALEDLPGGLSTTECSRISPDGNYVLGRSNAADGWYATRWDSSGAATVLGKLPGSRHSVANEASGGGGVVVGSSTFVGDFTYTKWWRWTAETGMVAPGSFPGAARDISNAVHITPDGKTVVGDAAHPDGSTYGFRWREDTGFGEPLRGIPGGTARGAAVLGASDNAMWVVGGAANADRLLEAVLWGPDGITRPLGTLGGSSSLAIAVTDAGDLVLGESFGKSTVWTPGKGMRPVTDFLRETGLDLDELGWRNVWMRSVTPDGRYLCGSGISPEGIDEAIRILIPTPSTLVLLAAAGTIITPRRRRA